MEEHNNNSNRPSGGGDNNKNPKNRQSILMFLIIAMVAILFWNYIGSMGNSSNTITYDEFVQMLDEGKVAKVEINSGSLKITAKDKDTLGREQIYTTGTGLPAAGTPGKSRSRIFRACRGYERHHPVCRD